MLTVRGNGYRLTEGYALGWKWSEMSKYSWVRVQRAGLEGTHGRVDMG